MSERWGCNGIETPRAWHVISDLDLMALLRRAHDGENPDLLYIEEYVNADRDEVTE